MAEKKEIPTKQEIDALCQLYLDADVNVEQAKQTRAMFADQIIDAIRDHGFLPKRATKSRRIEGEEFQATLSKSQSVEVNGTEVLRLRAFLDGKGLSRWFRKLFKREPVYVLRERAQEVVAKMRDLGAPSDLQTLFSGALDIKDNSPSLKVEPKAEPKKKEAKAS
jgi:hypothetical protein